jgi:hypothetical protein
MAWWWNKKKETDEESKVLEDVVKEAFSKGVAVEAEKKEEVPQVEEELEPESILSKYSIVPEKHETKILGESIGTDFLAAATNYASSYFKWKEDISDLEALKKSLDEKYNRLSRLNMENSQNGKELSKVIRETKEVIDKNKNYGERKKFIEVLYSNVKSFTPVLISYKDFDNILKKHHYWPGLSKDYGGFLTDQNIQGLEEIKEFDKNILDKHGYNRVLNILRKYPRALSDLPYIDDDLSSGEYPFAFLVDKDDNGWSYRKTIHPKYLCVCRYEQKWNHRASDYVNYGMSIREGMENEPSCELVDELKDLTLNRVYKEYGLLDEDGKLKQDADIWTYIKLYTISHNTILALYPTEKDSKSPIIIFQFYTDGVIVYGSLGEEDIFASLQDSLLDLSKKFYYQ